jgi:NDP-sugar pyrophosphorylase family protein
MKIRALVLAAGIGQRLRPLTAALPKPLMPIGGESVTAATLRQLARFGVEAAALNLHHLAAAIPRAFGDASYGMPLHYSPEPVLLGTGGALWPLRDFFTRADLILIVNGDSLCRWPLAEIVAQHRRSLADATLLLRRSPVDLRLGGGIAVGDGGWVTQIRKMSAHGESKSRHDFAGLHVLSPQLLKAVAEGESDVLESLYQPLLERGGRIATLKTGRPWHDLGDPRRYLDAVLAWQGGRRVQGAPLPAISPLAVIDPAAELSETVAEAGVYVASGVCCRRSILFAGVEVGAGADLEEVLAGPGARIPAGERLRRVIAMPGVEPGTLSLTPIA